MPAMRGEAFSDQLMSKPLAESDQILNYRAPVV